MCTYSRCPRTSAWAIGRPQPASPGARGRVLRERARADRTAGHQRRAVPAHIAQPGTFADIAAAAGGATDGVPDGLFIVRFGVDADNFREIREIREITGKVGS